MAKTITAEIWYKCKIRRTGDIIEGNKFQSVYNAVRLTLRDYMRNWSKSMFDSAITHIDAGILRRYNDGTEEFSQDHGVCLMGAVKNRDSISFYVERMDG